MPRAPRIDLAGALYHVISRGIERRAIFRTDRDRQDFLDRLADLARERAIRLFAYCLLDNHFHLLVERTETPLGQAMKRLLTGYAVSFNLRHDRIGHLFHGRFKAPLCERDSYLLELVRYVHLNPVRAGVVEWPEQFRWSSHRAYLGHDHLPGLECGPVLALLHEDLSEAQQRFRTFVADGVSNGRRPELTGQPLEAARQHDTPPSAVHLGGAILGSRSFAEAAISEADRQSGLAEKWRLRSVGIDEVAALVARATNIDIASLRRYGRRWAVAHARALLCTLAVDELGLRPREITRFLGLTDGAVSHALRRGRRLKRSETYHGLVKILRSRHPQLAERRR